MKTFLGLFLAFALNGCFFSSPPTVLDLQDQSGQSVGKAFAVYKNKFVTADHVFSTHRPLFAKGRLVTVLERHTVQDYMHFSLPKESVEKIKKARFRKDKILPETLVYWPGGSGSVMELNQDLKIRDRDYFGLIVVAGVVDPGQSGGPVYDKDERVIGLIVGGAPGKVFVRPLK